MISDVLSYSADAMREYLENMPEVYAETLPLIDDLLKKMDTVRTLLDAPPPQPPEISVGAASSPAMNLARAREIVIAICDRAMVTMDLPAKLDPLEGLSLADMIEASRMVQNANKAAQAAAAVNGGGYTIHVVPDDRLIAAVYALEHYQPQPNAMLAVPSTIPGQLKALAVVLAPAPGEIDDEA